MYRCVTKYHTFFCVYVHVCVCVCVCATVNCFQFLCFVFDKVETVSIFTLNDTSDLSCFSETRH